MAQPIKKQTPKNSNFSQELSYLLDYISDNIYSEGGFDEITPELFVLSALEEKNMLYNTVNTYLSTSSITNIHDTLYDYFQKNEHEKNLNKKIGSSAIRYKKPKISEELKHFFNEASEEITEEGALLTTDLVLLAILKEDNFITNLFKADGITYTSLKKLSKGMHDVVDEIKDKTPSNENKKHKEESENTITGKIKDAIDKSNIKVESITDFPFGKVFKITGDVDMSKLDFSDLMGDMLKQPAKKTKKGEIPFCTDLNKKYKSDGFDDLIGRTEEVDEVFRVLGRRQFNNVILVGENGVGKTQIVNGIVALIENDLAPLLFRGKRIVKFNPSEAIAGTSLRGQLEERIMEMTKILHEDKNTILFIDDMHNILSDRNRNEYDSGGIISQLFSDSDIQIIAATNDKGYKSITDSNPDVAKRFHRVNIDPTNEDDAYDILSGIKEKYEKYHNVKYSDEIIKACVNLSKKYISDKGLPSSAIDVLDELGSYRKLNDNRIKHIKDLTLFKERKEKDLNDALTHDSYDQIGETRIIIRDIEKDIAVVEGDYRDSEPMEVTMDDLYKTISLHTGIPVGKVKASDKKVLSEISNRLKNVIVGQDEAIELISRAIKRNKIGISSHTKPIGSFFFIGTSGVGKSLLAKTLAKEIFGDEKYLVRFDMSEYNDQTSVNKLIGSSAGYVGYNEGGLLTEAVKKQKYAVLLIDEIEKANEQVYNLFLQILDEGYLNDNMGQKVDFRNTIVILTSNIGTKIASQTHAIGFEANDNNVNKKEIIEKELKKKFSPEFINRLDSVVYFNSLTDDNLKEIIRLELKKSEKRLNNIGYYIRYNDEVVEHLFNVISDEKEYGARPIIRAICNEIENPITDMIIENEYSGHTFVATMEENKVQIS